jgi:hypothetical protein
MSHGGIYTGPGGEQLHGDGTPVFHHWHSADEALNAHRDALKARGWLEQPCDQWVCPKTGTKHGLAAAAAIEGLI